jgi:hypothetical protein
VNVYSDRSVKIAPIRRRHGDAPFAKIHCTTGLRVCLSCAHGVRFGSIATEEVEAARQSMSALHPKADKWLDASLRPLCAKYGLMQRSKKARYNTSCDLADIVCRLTVASLWCSVDRTTALWY